MEISEIKTRLSITEILGHYGLKADKNARLCCPFHEDKTPSMQVYEKTGTVYCFSANCKTHGRSMDVIEFILHKEGINKHEAIKKAESFLKAPQPPEGELSTEMKTPPVGVGGLLSRMELVNKLFTYFKNGLKLSPQAKEYCQLRGLEYDKIEIGFNGGQYHHGSRKDENLINACLAHGFLSENKAERRPNPSRTGEVMYNVFGKNSLVFGLKDSSNQVVSLYFRSILREAPKGNQARHFYLKDRQGLYPNYPAHYVPKLILTESIIDAATLLQNTKIAYEYSVLALYGTNGLTDEHQTAIKSIKNLDEIIFFFDGDGAGREAVKKYAPMLKEMVSQAVISVVECPENEDINSLLQSHEKGVLEHLLETRQPFISPPAPDGGVTEQTFSFSNEEKKSEVPSQQIPPSGVRGLLDTSNPFNLIYRTEAITYCIAPFRR
jgi:DNA primase